MATNSNSLHYKKHRIRMRRSGLQFLLCHKPGIWHRLIPVLSWAISSLEAFKELEYTSKAPPSQCISNSIKDSILLVKIFHSPSLKQTRYICSSKHLFILFFFVSKWVPSTITHINVSSLTIYVPFKTFWLVPKPQCYLAPNSLEFLWQSFLLIHLMLRQENYYPSDAEAILNNLMIYWHLIIKLVIYVPDYFIF